jgi:hypothetical protein
MFVRLFYSSISFMQIQIVEIAGLPVYAVVRERRIFWKYGTGHQTPGNLKFEIFIVW